MTVDFYLKKGDTLPRISATLKNSDGTPVNLTGATVKFRMRAPGGPLKVDGAAVVVDAAAGKVRYDWTGADTNTEGLFHAEWPVTFGSDVETIPNNGFLKVLIGPSLA